ncbi:hypothetical protein ACFWCB_10945 [Streptomyces sp. NPDC060048]|uniref:hypothetical protein n=1 Tax=unclassified Streptomyces TaxID=2593676 RepID=UPI0036C4CBA8
MQVHQDVPHVGGDTVQRLLKCLARVLVEFAVGADQDRAAAVLDVDSDQYVLLGRS